MKRILLSAVVSGLAALALTGCGGGGGGGGGVTTKAVSKVYLFGTMSSNTRFGVYSTSGKIASVQTSMTVPAGILANYSSPAPAGYPANTFPLRSGFVVPSGSVNVAVSDITGTYDTSSRILSLSVFNPPPGVLLKSGASGNGAEIATINFSLATPGTETAVPLADPLPVVSQARPSLTSSFGSLGNLAGCKVNFVTTYQ